MLRVLHIHLDTCIDTFAYVYTTAYMLLMMMTVMMKRMVVISDDSDEKGNEGDDY